VEELQDGLGDGQKIEFEMAKQVNLKVFRSYTNKPELKGHGRQEVSDYEGGIDESYDWGGIEIISAAVQA